jgi:cysteine synthase B
MIVVGDVVSVREQLGFAAVDRRADSGGAAMSTAVLHPPSSVLRSSATRRSRASSAGVERLAHLRQARVAEPRRLGEGPRGGAHDRRRRESGALLPGGTILDATSGNTGIAYAMIGAALGYRVRLCVPGNVTPERLRMLRAFGAEVVRTDPMDGSDGAIARRARFHAREPHLFYPDQYNNDANWRAHYDTTGVEIWEQTDGRSRTSSPASGTSGTFMGTTRRLRAIQPSVRAISVQPDGRCTAIEGLKHMATSIVPASTTNARPTTTCACPTEEAHAMTRRLAREWDCSPASRAARRPSRRRAVAARRRARSSSRSFPTAAPAICRSPSGRSRRMSTRDRAPAQLNARVPPRSGVTAGGVSVRMLRRADRRDGSKTDRRIVDAVELENVTDEGPRRRFRVSSRGIPAVGGSRAHARRRARRLLPFPSRSSRAAVAVRPRITRGRTSAT